MSATRQQRYRGSRRSSTAGFTLIEVLVVLALTLVMMSFFALIFSMTGTFVAKQKGIGENDQSARILTTVLKTDLQARTMRFVAPFHPNMTNASLTSLAMNAGSRQGYFYVSENDPTDDTDDVLQFTINMGLPVLQTAFSNPAAGTQLYGNALYLAQPWQPNTSYPPGSIVRPSGPTTNVNGFVFKNKTGAAFTSAGAEPPWPTTLTTVADGTGTWTALTSPIDQPDGDDGLIAYDANTPGNRTLDPLGASPNNTGGSQFAEVAYFLRHGNLIRRVELIRQPYDNSSSASGSSQPFDTDTPAVPLIPGAYPPYLASAGSGNFSTDFDYSARLTATTWQPTTAYGSPNPTSLITPPQTVVLPNPANGHTYTATVAGISGAGQPAWPTIAGATVTDGTVTWTTDVTPAFNFLGTGALENSLDNTMTAVPYPQGSALPIGRPDNRFGFDQTYATLATSPATAGVPNGAPREFAFQYNSTAGSITGAFPSPMFFFGRYTQEETSNPIYQFPGDLPVVGGANFLPTGAASLLALDSNSYTMWFLDGNPPTNPRSLAGGPRRGEDILLTNVVSFDVKLWDPHYSETAVGLDVNRNGVIDAGPGGFADIGHTATGDFAQANNVFPVYGPRIDNGYSLTGLPANTWAPAFTYTFNGLTYNYNNVFDTWYPAFNFDNLPRTYDTAVADTASLNAPAPYRPRLGIQWQPNTAYVLNQLVDPVNKANGYTYMCTQAGTSAATPPPGQPDPFTLADTVGTPNATLDGTVQWTPQPPVAVQAIQITVKYLDPSQNLLRQVTIVQSLTQ